LDWSPFNTTANELRNVIAQDGDGVLVRLSQLSLFLTEAFYGDFIFDTIILVYYGLV